MKPTLFIDRDGTLIEEPADFQIDSVEKFQLKKGVLSALKRLANQGFRFVMVTNQDFLGTERNPQEKFEEIQKLLLGILASEQIFFEEILICPHGPNEGCSCRKPKLGLLEEEIQKKKFDPSASWVIGDRDTDLQLARALGIGGILLDSWDKVLGEISLRKSKVVRKTKETEVEIEVFLDGTGASQIETPLGFFNHMLEQLSKHSGIDLKLKAQGDLHIDTHHLVEDVALALGQAIAQALGPKNLLNRYHFALPMDESLGLVAIDCGSRPYFTWEGNFEYTVLGDLPTEMIPHFFRSLSNQLGATVRMKFDGMNNHHKAEVIFKTFARALKGAIQVQGIESSTKGEVLWW